MADYSILLNDIMQGAARDERISHKEINVICARANGVTLFAPPPNREELWTMGNDDIRQRARPNMASPDRYLATEERSEKIDARRASDIYIYTLKRYATLLHIHIFIYRSWE